MGGGGGGGSGGGDHQVDGGAGGDFGGGGGTGNAVNLIGGAGGFGGGGGGAPTEAVVNGLGGTSAFGGGGGGGTTRGASTGGLGGAGGAGAGADGGGGAALGGAIFVRNGGTLSINDGGFTGAYGVTGGTTGGQGGATAGQSHGTVMFLHGTSTTTFGVSAGNTTVIDGNDPTESDIAGTGNLAKSGAGTLALLGDNAYSGTTTVNGGLLQVDGSIVSATTVNTGGTLGGNGTTGGVTVAAGGTLAPGASAGKLSTGAVAFAAGATFAAELGGTAAGTGGYDQLAVTGTLALGGATLNASLINGFEDGPNGAGFKLIDNDGSDAVTGIFAGLGEGAQFTIGGRSFSITYQGGSNSNDVVLTALNDAASATGLTQGKAYVEDAASVALDDIVVSDVDVGEAITATLTLANPAAGALTISGTATYTALTGVWTVTGTVAEVNAALAVVAFAPAANTALDTTITTHIEDAAGTGPGNGTITLDGTAVNDAPEITGGATAAVSIAENATA